MSVETKFYSSSVPQGRIVAQSPAAETRVRRGWKVRVAESLGPQLAAVPSFLGQSEHAASINISRRGLEVASVAVMHLPGASPGTVIAQSPPPNSRDVTSPRIDLIFAAAGNTQMFVMPNFAGNSLAEPKGALERAGFELGKVRGAMSSEPEGTDFSSSRSAVVVR